MVDGPALQCGQGNSHFEGLFLATVWVGNGGKSYPQITLLCWEGGYFQFRLSLGLLPGFGPFLVESVMLWFRGKIIWLEAEFT